MNPTTPKSLILEYQSLKSQNERLVVALAKDAELLRAVRYSMDRDVPFPSLEKITQGIIESETVLAEVNSTFDYANPANEDHGEASL